MAGYFTTDFYGHYYIDKHDLGILCRELVYAYKRDEEVTRSKLLRTTTR